MRTHRLATLLILVSLVCFAGLATARSPFAFGSCSALCPDGGSVTCKGSTCSAQDFVGCSYKIEDGTFKHRRCKGDDSEGGPDGPVTLAGRAPTSPEALDRPASVSWLVLPHGARQQIEAEHQAISDMAFAMTGRVRPFDPSATHIQPRSALASCTADCGGGKSVTCTAKGSDACAAVDNVACGIFHSDGRYTHKSCRDVLSEVDPH